MDPIHSNEAPKPVGLYPHARRAGDFLFLSGIGPRSADGSGIPGVERDAHGNFVTHDFAAQCHSVFRNVKAVLDSAGVIWSDLVDITVFLTDMQRDFHTYNEIYAEYFKEHQPCRTTVEIKSLPTPISIEVKCVAYIGESR